MNAKQVLEWIVKESINGELLSFIDVPEEGDNEWEQNEDWWLNEMGGIPPSSVPSGRYLYFYEAIVDNTLEIADVEIETNGDYILLFRIDE